MRLSITVLATLALALVAQGIPIPNPNGSGDEGGNTTPPPHPPSNPSTPPQPQPPHPQVHPSTAQLSSQYTPRTDPIHRGSVGWVAPTDYNPPGDNARPHPFIATNSPSPGGTYSGFGATHGIIGDGRNNQPANRYLPQGHPTSFQRNSEGHDTNINVRNRQRTNSGHTYDSTDHRIPSHIPEPGMQQLERDHADANRGTSSSRPRATFRGTARGIRGILGAAAAASNRGRGRGDGQPESSTRGRQPTRGNRGGGGDEASRSSSRGSSTSSTRRGASANSKGEHRSHPYSRDKS